MIPKGKGLPAFADDSTLNQIRGKAMVGHQTLTDVWTLLDHLQLLEHALDEDMELLASGDWREAVQILSLGFRRAEP